MEIDAQADMGTKAPKADETVVESWSDTSADYSVVSDGGPSPSAESTTAEVPNGRLDDRFKGCIPKRRFTHCPEKKHSSTFLESYPRRGTSSRSKPYFKRGRCIRNKLDTIFEHPVVTADDKVLFLRRLRVTSRPRRYHGLVFGSCRHGRRAVKMSVEEVDQLMMNLDIQQEHPVS